MVENINRIPEEDDYEDPDVLKKKKKSAEKKRMKSPLKSSQKPNMDSNAKSPGTAKSFGKVDRSKAPKSKLILSNQGGSAKRDFSKFEMPATFSTKYGEHQIN